MATWLTRDALLLRGAGSGSRGAETRIFIHKSSAVRQYGPGLQRRVSSSAALKSFLACNFQQTEHSPKCAFPQQIDNRSMAFLCGKPQKGRYLGAGFSLFPRALRAPSFIRLISISLLYHFRGGPLLTCPVYKMASVSPSSLCRLISSQIAPLHQLTYKKNHSLDCE